MDESTVKESRQLLRRIQDHLFQAHSAFGVEHETVGFVDVIHHPTNPVPDLNYVTPRRNTAWVSGKYVQEGLDRLKALGREPRVQYIEGLYPPLFAKMLGDLDLRVECNTALMVYVASGAKSAAPKPRTPSGARLEFVTDQSGVEMWRKVWRSPAYDVLTLGVEPLAVGRDLAAQRLGQEIDGLMYKRDLPVGVVRVSVQASTQSGHIVALALLREARTPQMMKVMLAAALRAALARGCTLVFSPGTTETDRAISRDLGFVESGSMVSYAAESAQVDEVGVQEHDDSVAQPVLALRR